MYQQAEGAAVTPQVPVVWDACVVMPAPPASCYFRCLFGMQGVLRNISEHKLILSLSSNLPEEFSSPPIKKKKSIKSHRFTSF